MVFLGAIRIPERFYRGDDRPSESARFGQCLHLCPGLPFEQDGTGRGAMVGTLATHGSGIVIGEEDIEQAVVVHFYGIIHAPETARAESRPFHYHGPVASHGNIRLRLLPVISGGCAEAQGADSRAVAACAVAASALCEAACSTLPFGDCSHPRLIRSPQDWRAPVFAQR